ncbi:hypothetical protein [Mesorhizobium marinum]|uniref:hypothetical protein n=1 Tax=Mesorhizobium marinum TaxID=3228790 RepID=UPI003465BE41
MRRLAISAFAALFVGGCSTNSTVAVENLRAQNTTALCQAWVNNPDQAYRLEVATILVGRGASPEKCYRLVASDNAIMTGIAVAAAGAAVGAAAANSGGGGYYPPVGAYGVAWDQFYNQYHQPIWRCRDRATGQFADDYRCAGMSMHDGTWPGWSA